MSTTPIFTKTFTDSYGESVGSMKFKKDGNRLLIHADGEPAVVIPGRSRFDHDADTDYLLTAEESWFQNGIQYNPNGASYVKYITAGLILDTVHEKFGDIISTKLYNNEDIISSYLEMSYFREWTDIEGNIIKQEDLLDSIIDEINAKLSEIDE